MAKARLHALTHNLAIELAGEGIRVNAVAPAVTRTPRRARGGSLSGSHSRQTFGLGNCQLGLT
ncbi:SDR family oxidoreductase [Streptomyces sp. NPDC054783]